MPGDRHSYRDSALAVYDDGSGSALYVGGSFSFADEDDLHYLARWNGASWSSVGNGVNNSVSTLHVSDNGDQAVLFAGGTFTVAGGVVVNRISIWDGQNWGALGNGLNGRALAITTLDDQSGLEPRLVVGGAFTVAGETRAQSLAAWNGNAWTNMGIEIENGNGISGIVYSLAVTNEIAGSQTLYVGGSFTSSGVSILNHVAQWDGQVWSSMSRGVSETANVVRVLSDANGMERVFIGGSFSHADSLRVNSSVLWIQDDWVAMGSGITSSRFINQNQIHDFAAFGDPTGAGWAVYAGGNFTETGGVPTRSVAKWGCLSGDGVIFSDGFLDH